MGGRGQGSKQLTQRPGESRIKFTLRKMAAEKAARAGTSKSYTNRTYSQNGISGREIITTTYDKRGNESTSKRYEINGKEVTYTEFRNNEPVFDMRRTTTGSRSASRRKSRMEEWMGIR